MSRAKKHIPKGMLEKVLSSSSDICNEYINKGTYIVFITSYDVSVVIVNCIVLPSAL